MEIVPYSAAVHAGAVERLNAKLAAAGSEFSFPTSEPKFEGARSSVWCEHFVAVEEGGVLGGYILKHQDFRMGAQVLKVDNLQLPLSLGLIDNRFSHVSVSLLFDALDRNALLYCLGMGSQQSKLVRMLTAAGWQHVVVPFFFSIKSGNRFARNIRLPAAKRQVQRILRLAGHLGLAGPTLWFHQRLSRRRSWSDSRGDARAYPVTRFDRFADELFDQHTDSYALVADRRSAALNQLYPEGNPKYLKLVVERDGRVVGWCVLLDTAMRDHKYFGNLRVGTLADGFAAPQDVSAVVEAADRFLGDRGVDVVVSNQMHFAWGEALEQAGYRQGPSNFFFYFSRALADQLTSRPGWDRTVHINRGDGDGPIHL